MEDRAEEEPLIGRTIAGKFKILSFLGRGSMGAVYKARQVALKKTVALKVMRVHGQADRAYGIRFKREASAASRLDHPNSVRVIDFGQEPDGLLYMAMDYVEGKNLANALTDDWPISPDRIVNVLSQVLAALAVAHDMGIVHRDLKPANILLIKQRDDDGVEREVVKVCDFGVAKILDEDKSDVTTSGVTASATTTLTSHGMTVGTPAYMSPEQALGEPTDARSDLYTMGIILYQLLTRQLPFEANTPIKMMLKQVHAEPPRPSEVRPGCDPRLEIICLRALSKKPGDRYQSAREMRGELLRESGPRQLINTVPPAAPPVRVSSGVMEAAPRKGATPTLILSIIAVILAATALVLALR